MTTTTYYQLNIVEGTDIVNPLIVDNPNYEKIDETMHNNAVAGVTLATEITNATVHAITRENSDCSVIRFIATSRWKAGDTVTVDGVPVTALLPSGETLPEGAYVINANVLCILTGTNLTFYLGGKNVENASEIKYKDTNVGAELDALNGSVTQINASVAQLNGSVEQINNSLKWNLINTVTGSNTISYDASLYKEIRIVVIISGGIKFVNTFQTDIISENTQNFVLGGYYKSSTANAACIVALSKTSAKISTITQNGTDKSTDAATSISLYGMVK